MFISSCGEWGLLCRCGAQASHCDGFSCCGAQALEHLGFGSYGSLAHGLGSSGSRVPEHRLNICGAQA